MVARVAVRDQIELVDDESFAEPQRQAHVLGLEHLLRPVEDRGARRFRPDLGDRQQLLHAPRSELRERPLADIGADEDAHGHLVCGDHRADQLEDVALGAGQRRPERTAVDRDRQPRIRTPRGRQCPRQRRGGRDRGPGGRTGVGVRRGTVGLDQVGIASVNHGWACARGRRRGRAQPHRERVVGGDVSEAREQAPLREIDLERRGEIERGIERAHELERVATYVHAGPDDLRQARPQPERLARHGGSEIVRLARRASCSESGPWASTSALAEAVLVSA